MDDLEPLHIPVAGPRGGVAHGKEKTVADAYIYLLGRALVANPLRVRSIRTALPGVSVRFAV